MEQMYLVEILIDKVTIFAGDDDSSANKKLIIKIKFGPTVQFIIKEGQLSPDTSAKDDVIQCDDHGRRKWSRTIRVGKSYLFPSYPDTVMMTLSKFPLEIEVWNDDETEVDIFVGIGTMQWDTQFFHMLKETAESCKRVEPLTIKQITPLFAECCCKQCGEITFILRLGSLGESIITEFQQLMKDPDSFVFRTNKAPSMFTCKRIEGDNPNFCMVGSLYETTTLEDPEVAEGGGQKKIEICTDLQSCGMGQGSPDTKCEHSTEKEKPKKKSYPLDKIKMGDIVGPCGNTNCALAHKVRTYIRNLDSYKAAASAVSGFKEGDETKKICGTCSCKDDRWHRAGCPDSNADKEPKLCTGCGGISADGVTCDDRKQKMFGTGATPKGSKTQVNYMLSVTRVPDYKDSVFGSERLAYQNTYYSTSYQSSNMSAQSKSGCGCSGPTMPSISQPRSDMAVEVKSKDFHASKKAMSTSYVNTNPFIYNVAIPGMTQKVFNCTEVPNDKSCKCNPPKPTPPCHTLDCDCIEEMGNSALRKAHKPYCPRYKHKSTCPVTMDNEDEKEKERKDDDEDETEPLPYGLPPIQLGPCPVLGKPCSYPDGFTRMYKTGAQPPQPPSYSDAGKVCCSKEYEKIKKAIKDYMKYEKDHDYRCVNKFNVDTERRCCDKEQALFPLIGKDCCGTHKLSIQDKFKQEK